MAQHTSGPHSYETVKSAFDSIDAHVKQQLTALQEHYNGHVEDESEHIALDGGQVTAKHKAAFRAAGMSSKAVHFVTVVTNYRNFLREEMQRGAEFVHDIVDTMEFAVARMNAVASATSHADLYQDKNGQPVADVSSQFMIPQLSL